MLGCGCGFVYTSAESVGLGMDLERSESRSLCNIWGWIVRLFYAFYLAARCAHYFAFIADHGSTGADLAGMLLLDINFFLAVAVNYRLSTDGHLVRHTVSIFPDAMPGNPRAFFNNALAFVTLLVWGVAIFSSVYLHEHAGAESSVERSFLVLSYYVNGIFVFGTFCFSMALFDYTVYCLCNALQEYRKKLNVLFSRPPKPVIMDLVLRDFCSIRNLIRDVSGAFRVIVFLWFAAGTVYAVELATRWAYADSSPGLAPSVLRVGALTALLFFSSDLAGRLRGKALSIRAALDTFLDTMGHASRQEAYVVVHRFAADCFAEDTTAVWLIRRWCLGRRAFLAWLIAVAVLCASAAAICYHAAN